MTREWPDDRAAARAGDRPHDGGDETEPALEPALRELAAAYHQPPPVPREEMWAAIEARRRARPTGRSGAPFARPGRYRWQVTAWRMAAGLTILALGVGTGWWLRAGSASGAGDGRSGGHAVAVASGPAAGVGAPGAAGAREDAAYQIAVARNLTQAEALLTAFHEAERGRGAPGAATADVAASDAQLAGWARDVLSTTRLLLDSRAASDPQRRRLLEDLELVLVQIVAVAPDHSRDDRQMIDRTLDRGHVLTRIRTAVPAGPAGT